MNAQYLRSKFDAALDWEAYLATDPDKAQHWRKVYEQARLTPRTIVSWRWPGPQRRR
jgi:hypothetical protein